MQLGRPAKGREKRKRSSHNKVHLVYPFSLRFYMLCRLMGLHDLLKTWYLWVWSSSQAVRVTRLAEGLVGVV